MKPSTPPSLLVTVLKGKLTILDDGQFLADYPDIDSFVADMKRENISPKMDQVASTMFLQHTVSCHHSEGWDNDGDIELYEVVEKEVTTTEWVVL